MRTQTFNGCVTVEAPEQGASPGMRRTTFGPLTTALLSTVYIYFLSLFCSGITLSGAASFEHLYLALNDIAGRWRNQRWQKNLNWCPTFLGANFVNFNNVHTIFTYDNMRGSISFVFGNFLHDPHIFLHVDIFFIFSQLRGQQGRKTRGQTMRPNHWDGGSMLSYQLQSIL